MSLLSLPSGKQQIPIWATGEHKQQCGHRVSRSTWCLCVVISGQPEEASRCSLFFPVSPTFTSILIFSPLTLPFSVFFGWHPGSAFRQMASHYLAKRPCTEEPQTSCAFSQLVQGSSEKLQTSVSESSAHVLAFCLNVCLHVRLTCWSRQLFGVFFFFGIHSLCSELFRC